MVDAEDQTREKVEKRGGRVGRVERVVEKAPRLNARGLGRLETRMNEENSVKSLGVVAKIRESRTQIKNMNGKQSRPAVPSSQ